MKRLNILTASLLTAIAIASCSTEKKSEVTEKPVEEVKETKTKVADVSDSFTFRDENVKAIFNSYVELRTALTNSNNEEASKSAEMLVEVLKKAPDTNDAIDAAGLIANAPELKTQRIAFSTLSDTLLPLLSSNLNSGELYIAHCPMAMDNVGANWITKTKDIMNPYFGDMMLKCGSITETIASAK